LSSAICTVTVSALGRTPMVMLDSSGAPLEPLLALGPELHAVMPTVSPAIAITSALWQIREAFIVLLLF
jgi:hypothetical protein